MSETPFSLLACGRKSLLRFGDARNFVDATRVRCTQECQCGKTDQQSGDDPHNESIIYH